MAELEDESSTVREDTQNGDHPEIGSMPNRDLLEFTANLVLRVMHRVEQLDAEVKKSGVAAVVAGETARHAQDNALDAMLEARGAKTAAVHALAELVKVTEALARIEAGLQKLGALP